MEGGAIVWVGGAIVWRAGLLLLVSYQAEI